MLHINQEKAISCQIAERASVCLQEPGTMDSVRSGPYGQIFRPVSCILSRLTFCNACPVELELAYTCIFCCRTTLSLDRQELETTGQRVTTQRELN